MQTPPPTPIKKLHHEYDIYAPTDYHPRGRRDLTPIFELVAEMCQPQFKQKSYRGKKRILLIKADL